MVGCAYMLRFVELSMTALDNAERPEDPAT
jgi:hypothetical protein